MANPLEMDDDEYYDLDAARARAAKPELLSVDELMRGLAEVEASKVPCPRCSGKGYRLAYYGWLLAQEPETCRRCNGTGRALPTRSSWLSVLLHGARALLVTRAKQPPPAQPAAGEGTYRDPPLSEVELLREEINDAHAQFVHQLEGYRRGSLTLAIVLLGTLLLLGAHVGGLW